MSSNRRSIKVGLFAILLVAAPVWAQNKLLVSCNSQAQAGAQVSCNITLSLQSSVQVDALQFTVSVSPTSGTASYTDTLTGGLVSNHVTYTSVIYNGVGPLGAGSTAIGTMKYTLPGGATGGQSFTAAFTGAEASFNSVDVVPSLDFSSSSTTTIPVVLAVSGLSSPLPSGTVGVAYSPITATGVGGTGTGYTFSASSLPSGLTMSSGGTISGTPT